METIFRSDYRRLISICDGMTVSLNAVLHMQKDCLILIFTRNQDRIIAYQFYTSCILSHNSIGEEAYEFASTLLRKYNIIATSCAILLPIIDDEYRIQGIMSDGANVEMFKIDKFFDIKTHSPSKHYKLISDLMFCGFRNFSNN